MRTKVIAILLGTAGLGIFSQLANVSNLIVVIIPIGSIGITRYLSEFFEEKKQGQISFLIKKILIINLPIALLISVTLICFPKFFSQLLYSDNSYWYLILIFSFSIPLSLIVTLTDIYFRSIRIIKLYVKYTILSSICSLIIFVPIIYFLNLAGAGVSYLSTYIISIVLAYIILKKNSIIPSFKKLELIDPVVLKKINTTGLVMIIIYVIQQLSYIFIRSIIAGSLSINELGIYQSVYAISTNYFALFFTIIYTYSFPKFSTFKRTSEIILETNQTLKFLILIYTPLIIIFFVFREFFLILLYSDSFINAKELLFFQLIGDFLKMLSWVFAIWLIPNLRIKAWAIFDIIFFVNYLGIFYCLFYFTNLSIKSISISYFISYTVHLVINFSYIKYSLKFKFTHHNLLKVIISLSVIILVFCIAQYNAILGYILFSPILIIWLFLCVNKVEFIKLKEMVFLKIKQI